MKMTPMESGKIDGPNKYGQHKVWENEGKTGKPFVSADDSMAYVSTTKTAVFDPSGGKLADANTTTAPEDVIAATPPSVETPPYQKVDYKKRYDDLKRHYDSKVEEFKKKEKELGEKLAGSLPKYTPPTSEAELEEFKRSNPEIYNVAETLAHMRASTELQEVREELKTLKEKYALEEARHAYAELKALVPDFEQIRQSEDFHNWADEQPEEIQNWVYKNATNYLLAAKAINLYKADRGITGGAQPTPTPAPPPTPTPRGADESVTVTGRAAEPTSTEKIWTTSEIGSLSTAQYEKYRDEIDRAQAEGRVVRDKRR